MIIVTESVIAA